MTAGCWWENAFPILEVNLVEWRMESSASGTLDLFDIEWNDSNTLRFAFRSSDGACEGEPTVACTSGGLRAGSVGPAGTAARRAAERLRLTGLTAGTAWNADR